MSYQGKWWKAWTTALTDPDLENLELHQWARWVRLGLFIKAHGNDGKMTISYPARSLQNTLRTNSYEELIGVLQMLPSYKLLEASQTASHQASQLAEGLPISYLLVCKNWNKYQGDFSVHRTRKWRQNKSVTDSVTGDGKSDGLRREEKRGDVTPTSTLYSRRSAPPPAVGAAGVAPRETAGLAPPSPPEPSLAEIHAMRVKAIGCRNVDCEFCRQKRKINDKDTV